MKRPLPILTGALLALVAGQVSVPAIIFDVGDASVVAGNPVTLTLTTQNFTDVSSLMFSLAWNSSVFQSPSAAIGTSFPAGGLIATPEPGVLTFMWTPADGNAKSLTGMNTVLTLTLNAIGTAPGGNYGFNFADDPTPREVTTTIGGVDLDVTASTTFSGGSVSVTPVPEPISTALCIFGGLVVGGRALRYVRARKESR